MERRSSAGSQAPRLASALPFFSTAGPAAVPLCRLGPWQLGKGALHLAYGFLMLSCKFLMQLQVLIKVLLHVTEYFVEDEKKQKAHGQHIPGPVINNQL